jgi:alcohol dehydrogenase (cytochrome c)
MMRMLLALAALAGAQALPICAVAQIEPVLVFRMQTPGAYAGAVVHGAGLLFVETPFPHTVFALDPARPGSPVRWAVTPRADTEAAGQACCGTVAGPVLDGATLYVNTFDGHTMALDAGTGRVAWDVQTAQPGSGETLNTAPLVADGKVFVGGGGDAFGARGFVEALDAGTGRVLWRRTSTGPDADTGAASGDLGIRTWPPDTWQHGGGAVAGLAEDAALGLLFHGTGHPAPADPAARTGENRWTSGLFARETAGGAARWFVPINPHDRYGFGAVAPNLLVDHTWHGAARHLLVHPDSNGRVYVLDQGTGEVLSDAAFVSIRDRPVQTNMVARDICPAAPGATGPGTAAYADGLLYMPVTRLCMDLEVRNTSYMSGTPYSGANIRLKAAGPNRGAVVAWDLEAGKPAWTEDERFPVRGGVAAADGLVIYGTLDGQVKALDARTGELRWRYQAPFGITSTPALWHENGRRYLAVLAGLEQMDEIDMRDATAASGMANALRDLPVQREPGGALLLFVLPP